MKQKPRISNQEELLAAITLLENERSAQSAVVRKEFWALYEGLKPVNLIKNTIADMRNSPELSGGMINSAIGIASGVITKKLFVGSSHNPVRNVVGTLLMFGVKKLISANQPIMNAIGNGILKLTKRTDTPGDEKE
jgi:hypothetical protein